MNKILKLLLLLTTVSTIMCANITKEEVDNLINKSYAGLFLYQIKVVEERKAYTTFVAYEIFCKTYNIKLEKTAKNKAKAFVDNIKYDNIYKSYFFNLDDQIYNDIIDFYATNTGKKIIEREKEIFAHKQILAEYEKIKDINISEEKLTLLKKILIESNAIDEGMKCKEGLLKSLKYISKEHIISDDKIKKIIDKHKPESIEYQKKRVRVRYKDFSKKELQEVLSYYSKGAGKIESKLEREAYTDLITQFTKDSSNELDKEMKRIKELLMNL